MTTIDTDYLVIGAGASGMAFIDTLITETDADVVMVDRRHRPGGHWNDAYPFVGLHQPSAYYGVNSRPLGNDRIDEWGPNAGFYERAAADEICDYYRRVLDEQFLPSGQVRFLGMHDYRGKGASGHELVSSVTGETTTVRARQRLVDATYMESTIPATHTPVFAIDDVVQLVTPNGLVDLREAAPRYTVLGAGKTAMDTCSWLLDQGVDADLIRWIRPRDVWMIDRAGTQPLAKVGEMLDFNARLLEAAAAATSVTDYVHRLEEAGVWMRLDPEVEPDVFRSAIASRAEVDGLRSIRDVVREGRVRRIAPDRIILDGGAIPAAPGDVHIDCTAPGLYQRPARPVFETGRITIQAVTLGVAPWSAATIAYVEVARDDDAEKNRLCPSASPANSVAEGLPSVLRLLQGQGLRMAEPDLVAWNSSCRLNPLRGVTDRLDDRKVQGAFARMAVATEQAIVNLEHLAAGPLIVAAV